jgi:hypothetical protein
MRQKDAQKLERYRRKIEQLKAFLRDNDKKRGPTGNEQKGNLTDPESAKMTSSRGVIQGYNGLAVVDDKAQVVVHAEAHGSGYEAHLLAPVLEATRNAFEHIHHGADIFEQAKVTADSGFHSKAVVSAIEQIQVDAYVADRDYRRRLPVFGDAVRYKERERKERALKRKREREASPPKESRLFTVSNFIYDEEQALCICPAGHHFIRPVAICSSTAVASTVSERPSPLAETAISETSACVIPSVPSSANSWSSSIAKAN